MNPREADSLTRDIEQMVERQARAWERNDPELAVSDWSPDGVLVAPGASVTRDELPQAIADFHTDFCNLEVTIKNVFASSDGRQAAIEWDWAVTRKRDGERSVTHDAIIVSLIDGKISSWREYFDRLGAVETP
jgi:uncharacterized protein (TIGR02246 family)